MKTKLLKRLRKFKNHPVGKKHLLKSVFRYIDFNIRGRLFKSVKYPFVHGLKIKLQLGDSGLVGNVYTGLRDFEESCFIFHLFRNKDLLLDLGANLGHYSLLVAGLRGARSFAVEPIPQTKEKLLAQLRMNNLLDKVEIHNCGLSDKESELYFSTDRGPMNSVVDANYENKLKIRVSTVNDLFGNADPLAIKLDVEGYEKFVLEGASRVLNNPSLKCIIIELNQYGSRFGSDDDDIFNLLKKWGFLPYKYSPRKRELKLIDSYNLHTFNTIFLRDIDFVKERVRTSEPLTVWGESF